MPADKPFGKTAIALAETRATLPQMDKNAAPQRLKKLAQGDPLAFQNLHASTGTRALDADKIHDWLRENKIPGEQWDAIGQQVARHGAQRVIAAHERGDNELKGLEALKAQTTHFFLDERITFLWQQRDAIAQLLPGQDFTQLCQTVATTGKAWLEGRPVGSPEGTVALMALDQPAFSMQDAVQSRRWQPGPDEIAWLQTLPVSRAVAEALLASQAPGAAEKVLAQHDLIGGGCHLYPWLPRPNLYQALQDAPFDPESPVSRAAMDGGQPAGRLPDGFARPRHTGLRGDVRRRRVAAGSFAGRRGLDPQAELPSPRRITPSRIFGEGLSNRAQTGSRSRRSGTLWLRRNRFYHLQRGACHTPTGRCG